MKDEVVYYPDTNDPNLDVSKIYNKFHRKITWRNIFNSINTHFLESIHSIFLNYRVSE